MIERPKIKVPLNSFDKSVEVLSLLAIIAIWGIAIYYFPKLPDTIPTHFNVSGAVDDYGSKLTIFLLPGIGSILYVLLTLLNKFPHVFNYTKEITQDNALAMYSIATQMMRVLKFVISLIFLVISYGTIEAISAKGGFLGIWLLPMILCAVFGPTIYYIIKMNRS